MIRVGLILGPVLVHPVLPDPQRVHEILELVVDRKSAMNALSCRWPPLAWPPATELGDASDAVGDHPPVRDAVEHLRTSTRHAVPLQPHVRSGAIVKLRNDPLKLVHTIGSTHTIILHPHPRRLRHSHPRQRHVQPELSISTSGPISGRIIPTIHCLCRWRVTSLISPS
jgi:hypothetical protein